MSLRTLQTNARDGVPNGPSVGAAARCSFGCASLAWLQNSLDYVSNQRRQKTPNGEWHVVLRSAELKHFKPWPGYKIWLDLPFAKPSGPKHERGVRRCSCSTGHEERPVYMQNTPMSASVTLRSKRSLRGTSLKSTKKRSFSSQTGFLWKTTRLLTGTCY